MEGKAICEKSDNGNQTGAKISSNQLSCTIAFFQGKVTSIGTFKEKKVFIFTSLALKWHMQTAV